MTNNLLHHSKNPVHYVAGKQRFIVAKPDKLKYTPLKYLQNDWTSWITVEGLNSQINTNCVIELACRVIEWGTNKAGQVFGGGTESAGSDAINFILRSDNNTMGRVLGCQFNTQPTALNQWYVVELRENACYCNGIKASNSGTSSGTMGGTAFSIFRNYFSTDTSFLTYGGIYQISSFRIRDPSIDTVLLDLLPVLDTNGTPCMWDKVADHLYYNEGSGTFSYEEWDYDECDYLALDETAWGDTYHFGNQDTSYEFIAQSTTVTATSAPIFGARTNATTDNIATYMPGGNNLTSAIQDFGNYSITRQTTGADFKYRYKFYNSKEKRIVENADTHTATRNTNVDDTDFETPRTLKIGVVDLGFNTGNKKFIGNLWDMKIWNKSTLVRDFIPVRIDGVGAYYDRCLNTIFFSNGATPFNPMITDRYGKEFKVLDYAFGNGNKTIDTEYLPNANTEIYCKFKFDNPTSTQNRLYGVTCPANQTSTTDGQVDIDFYINGANIFAYSFGNLSSNGGGSWQATNIAKDTKVHVWRMTKTEWYLDSTSGDLSKGTFTDRDNPTASVYLFGTNLCGTGNIGNSYVRIYKWTASENGVIKANFLPVKDETGKTGMINTVTRKVHYNANNGVQPYTLVDTSGNHYTRVKEIRSTGAQYINTGITPTNETSMYLWGDFYNNSGTTRAGNRNGGNVNCYILITQTDSKFRLDVGNGSSCQWLPSTTGTHAHHIEYEGISQRGQFNFANGTLERRYYPITAFTANSTIYLFAYYFANDGTVGYASDMPINHAIIKHGSTTMDLVPAIDSNNEAGLFDLVSDTFIRNSGTGAFTYQDMDTVYNYKVYNYLESAGAQFINQNFELNEGDVVDLYIDFEYTTTDYSQAVSGWYTDNVSPTSRGAYLQSGSSSIPYIRWAVGADTLITDVSTSTIANNRLTWHCHANDITKFRAIYDSNDNLLYSDNYTGTLKCPNQYLFGRGYNNNTSIYEGAKVKIYSCKYVVNGVLIRDYIPVVRRSDSKPGMYDKVNNVFYINKGSNDFTYG